MVEETGGGYNISSFKGFINISYLPLRDNVTKEMVSDDKISEEQKKAIEKIKQQSGEIPSIKTEKVNIVGFDVTKDILTFKEGNIYMYNFKSNNYYFTVSSDKVRLINGIISHLHSEK